MKKYRHRERILADSNADCYGVDYDSSGNPTSWLSSYGPFAENTAFESMSDYTGNFGGNNPVYHTKTSLSEEDGSLSYRSRNDPLRGGDRYGMVTSHFLALPFYVIDNPTYVVHDINGAIAEAKLKCLAGIESTPYEFGEDIAEMHSLLSFVSEQGSLIQSISKDLKRVIKGNYSVLNKPTYRKLLSAVQGEIGLMSKIHLTAAFGYGNAVRSISNAISAYNERNRAKPIQRVSNSRVFLKDQIVETVIRRRLSTVESQSIDDSYTHAHASILEVHAQVYYTHLDPISDFRFDLGIRGKDLLPTAWAIAPASWFIDSFVNISDAIYAAENVLDPRIRVEKACYSVREDQSDRWQLIAITDHRGSSGSDFTGSGGLREDSEETYARHPWTPTLADAIPRRVKVPTNMRTIMNDAAFTLLKLNKRFRVMA